MMNPALKMMDFNANIKGLDALSKCSGPDHRYDFLLIFPFFIGFSMIFQWSFIDFSTKTERL